MSIDRILRGNPDDLEKIDKVQLAMAENKISATIPVAQQDLFVAALPYAGDVINSVMSAVKKVDEIKTPVELVFTLKPTETATETQKGENNL